MIEPACVVAAAKEESLRALALVIRRFFNRFEILLHDHSC